MSPPRIASSGSPFDRRLVGAARTESPSEGAEARAVTALGLSMGLATPVGSLTRGAPRLPLPWLTAVKAIGVAAIVMLGAVVAIRFTRTPQTPPLVRAPLDSTPVFAPPEASREPAVLAVPSAAPAAATGWVGDARAPSAAHARRPASAPTARLIASASAAVTRTPDERLPLSAEIALVQQAKRALAADEAGVALGVLDAHDRMFPHGVLTEEAGVLRVQALARTGDAAGARTLARALLAADPHGVLAPQLRGVAVGPADSGPTPRPSGAP